MDDTISRQATITAFLTELTKRERKNLLHTWSTVEVKYFIVEMMEQMPTAERKGHWIYGENDCQDGWFCSKCGGFVPWDYDYYGLNNINFIADFKTCPFCDAKMVSYTGKDLREGEKE